MLIENKNYDINTIPNRCILFFKSANCNKCLEQYLVLKDNSFDFDIIVLDEENGYELGTHFSVFATPVLIYIDNKEEYKRTYGVKTIKEIEINVSDY